MLAPDWRHRTDAHRKDKMPDPLKLDLMETGTRWEHYAELLDLFAEGIEVLKRGNFRTPADRSQQVRLEHAVEVISGRLDFLAGTTAGTAYGSPLRKVIDREIEPLMSELKIEEAENAAQNKDDDSDRPETYTTK